MMDRLEKEWIDLVRILGVRLFRAARTILNFFGVQRSISELKVQIHFWRRAFLLRILDCQNRQPQNDG